MTAPSVAAVGAEGSGILGAAAAVPVPSGVVAGSLVLLISANYNSGGGGVPSGGSGTWRELTSIAGGVPYVRVWWKRATAADSGNYSLSNAGVESVTGAAYRIVNDDGSIFPFGQFTLVRGASSTATPNVSLSAVGEESLNLWLASTGDNQMTSFPANYAGQTSGNRRSHLATRVQSSQGATGNVSGTLQNAYPSVAGLIAVKALRGPVVAAVSPTAAGTTNCTVTIPDGVVNGSVVVLFGTNQSNAALTPPAGQGWQEIVAYVAGAPRIYAWWKRATGAESGTYTVSGNALNNVGGFAMRIANDDGSSNPFGQTDSDRTSANGTVGPALDLASAIAESLLIHAMAANGSRIFTPETDFTMHSDVTANQRVGVSSKTHQVTGASGTVDGGVTVASANISGLLFAVKPIVPAAIPDVIIGGNKKAGVGSSVIIGGAKKAVTARSVIIGGNKKTVV